MAERRSGWWAGVLLALFGLGGTAATAQTDDDLEHAMIRAYEAAGAPALGLVTGDASGQTALLVRGRHSTRDAMPVAPDARWHIGSNAKAMTATLALVLAENGVLALDDPLTAFFPDLSLHPDLAEVPFAALLEHRSGLGANLSPGQMLDARRSRLSLPEQRADLAARWLARAPAQAPGRFVYSNLGYIIAGAAMEARTGADWFDLMQTHVFDPLDIHSAGLGAPAGDAPEGHRSFLGLMLRPEPAESAEADNPLVMGPAGTLHLSLTDHARFLASHLPGGPLLSEVSRARLFTTPDPEAELPYAFGWARVQHPVGGKVWQHAGSNTLWFSIARIDPETGRAAVVVANAATASVEAALRDLLDAALPPPPR